MLAQIFTFQIVARSDPYPFSFHFFLTQICQSNWGWGEAVEARSGFKLLYHSVALGLGSLWSLGIMPGSQPSQHRAQRGDGTCRCEPAQARGREIIRQTKPGLHARGMKGQQL